MIKEPSEQTLNALAQMAKAVGDNAPFHIAPIYLCDNCKDDTKEAFPYGVYDRHGKLWSDLCNDCFDALGCKYSEYEYVYFDQRMFLGIDWAYPLIWDMDLKPIYKSLWLGWWLITWTYDDNELGNLSISFQPSL